MKEEVKKLLENLLENGFLLDAKSIEYEIQEQRVGTRPFFKIVLPAKGEKLAMIIGKQGMTLYAINKLFSVWGFQKGVIVRLVQKRAKNDNESN